MTLYTDALMPMSHAIVRLALSMVVLVGAATPSMAQRPIKVFISVDMGGIGGVTAEQLRLDLSYKSYTPAEMMAYLPGIVRVDAHTVRYQATSIRDISRFLEFATSYRADLTP